VLLGTVLLALASIGGTSALDLGQSGSVLTPGLSGSYDYSDFDSIKVPIINYILSIVNKLDLPEITFTDGYMKGMKLIVKQNSNSLIFIPFESENALSFQISNIIADLNVNQFAYTGLPLPIRGYLKVKMQGIFLRVKVKFQKLYTREGRVLPQINITESKFEIDTKKVQFDLGGNFLLAIADLLVPILKGYFRGPLEKLVSE
jgi:hypothetical protein